MRYWFVVYRAGKRLSLVAQGFEKFVKEESAKLLDLPGGLPPEDGAG